MDHEEASLLLVDRHQGRLEARTSAQVDEHLAECNDCHEALDTIEMLKASTHLSSDRIVALALEPTPDEGEPANRGEVHLESCASCAAEIASCRAAVGAARAGRPRLRPRVARFVPAVAAAAVTLAVLGYPAYLGLVTLPESRRQIEESAASEAASREEVSSLREMMLKQAASPAQEGTIPALFLGVTRGGEQRTPAIELRPGASVIAILLEPAIPRETPDAARLRFEITDPSGRLAWSSDSNVGELREGQNSPDRVVTLLVPSRFVPAGRYTLSLGTPGARNHELLLEAPFETREAPAAPGP